MSFVVDAIAKAWGYQPTLQAFLTVAPAPDGSSICLPAVLQGRLLGPAVKHAEAAKSIEAWREYLAARLSILYQISHAEEGNVTNVEEVRGRLCAILEMLLRRLNAELVLEEKDRAWGISWSMVSNEEFLRRFGKIDGRRDQAYLGGWVLEKESPEGQEIWTSKEQHFPLRHSIHYHIALSSDGHAAKMFLVPLGWDREAKEIEGWFSSDFWEGLESSSWTTRGPGAQQAQRDGIKERFHDLLKEQRVAGRKERFITAGSTLENFCRLFPEWAPRVQEHVGEG